MWKILRSYLLKVWACGIPLRVVTAITVTMLLGLNAVPAPVVEAVRAARAESAAQRYASAAFAYRQAYEYTPGVREYLIAAIESQMLAGRYADAEIDLQRLAAIRPLTVREQVWLGEIYLARDERDRAVAAWEQAWNEGALDSATLSQLATLYAERRQWPEAMSALEALIEQTPQDASLYYRLGVLQSLDSPQQAATTLAQSVALDPTRAADLAQLRAALEGWDPQSLDLSYANLGIRLLALDELPQAEEALARAVAYNTVYADALAFLAYVRALQNKPALGAAQQAAALAPDNPRVFFFVGRAWQEYNRPVEARQAFEHAYDLDPLNAAICVEIASTHRAEGSLEWAEIWMLESVRLNPGDPRFRLLLVQFYVDEEYRVEEAGLPLALELVADYPDSAEAHDALAWAYFLLGDLERAQAELDIAMTLNPNLGRAFVHMAQLMEVHGRLSEALWYYLRAQEMDPDGPVGALARRAIERLGGG